MPLDFTMIASQGWRLLSRPHSLPHLTSLLALHRPTTSLTLVSSWHRGVNLRRHGHIRLQNPPHQQQQQKKSKQTKKFGEAPNLSCPAVYYNTSRSIIPALISCVLVLLFLILSWYISHRQPSHKRLTVCLLKPLTVYDDTRGSDVWPQWRPSKTQTILMLHASLLVSSTTAKKKKD